MPRLREAHVGDRGHPVRPATHAADGLVHRLLDLRLGKDGVSALSLQRTLEIGSYATAWAMLHRLRSVLVRPGRDRLTGTVEVDETYIRGEEAGLAGGRAQARRPLWQWRSRSTNPVATAAPG